MVCFYEEVLEGPLQPLLRRAHNKAPIFAGTEATILSVLQARSRLGQQAQLGLDLIVPGQSPLEQSFQVASGLCQAPQYSQLTGSVTRIDFITLLPCSSCTAATVMTDAHLDQHTGVSSFMG